jgi:hypothetical protein
VAESCRAADRARDSRCAANREWRSSPAYRSCAVAHRAAPAESAVPAAPTLHPAGRSDSPYPPADKSGAAPPSTIAVRHHHEPCSRAIMPSGTTPRTFGSGSSPAKTFALILDFRARYGRHRPRPVRHPSHRGLRISVFGGRPSPLRCGTSRSIVAQSARSDSLRSPNTCAHLPTNVRSTWCASMIPRHNHRIITYRNPFGQTFGDYTAFDLMRTAPVG